MSPDDVLHFWFGDGEPLDNSKAWYTKSDAFDATCTTRFGAAIDDAVAGELDAWKTSPRGRLALVILLDQLSRNIHRGKARSFSQDPIALAVATEALAAGDEAAHDRVRASFLLMPFMHAEDMTNQQRCIDGFAQLARAETDAERRAFLENGESYARKHAAIIERFGRFPHRNGILGRTSTYEEAEFLKQPGSSF